MAREHKATAAAPPTFLTTTLADMYRNTKTCRFLPELSGFGYHFEALQIILIS